MVLSSDKIAFGKGLPVKNRKLPTRQKGNVENLELSLNLLFLEVSVQN